MNYMMHLYFVFNLKIKTGNYTIRNFSFLHFFSDTFSHLCFVLSYGGLAQYGVSPANHLLGIALKHMTCSPI